MRAAWVVIGLLILPRGAYAQSDWRAVTTLSPETRLRIESAHGGDAKGPLLAVDDLQLTLKGKLPAARTDIRLVEKLGRRQPGKFARRGLLIGAVCGGILGFSTAQSSRALWAGLMALGWGGIGATIGAIEGLQSRERTVIYRRP